MTTTDDTWRDAGPLLLFVAFHHVREAVDPKFPGLHIRTVATFRRQLELLARHFEFPDPAGVRACLHGNSALPVRSCVLTFDDGLRDHHDHVAPILKELGIQGVFSVSTGPWEDGRMLSVHMAHLLSGAHSYESLAGEFEAAARNRGVTAGLADVPMSAAEAQYFHDTPTVARIKFFINAMIPQHKRDEVLSDVFTARFGNADFLASHYMTPQMVKNLHDAGHTIALHTHRHIHLAAVTPESRAADLRRNIAALRAAIGATYRPWWIVYPYGSPSAVNQAVIADCVAAGCDTGLTMARGINRLPVQCAMSLARVDTNEAEGGNRPIQWSRLLT